MPLETVRPPTSVLAPATVTSPVTVIPPLTSIFARGAVVPTPTLYPVVVLVDRSVAQPAAPTEAYARTAAAVGSCVLVLPASIVDVISLITVVPGDNCNDVVLNAPSTVAAPVIVTLPETVISFEIVLTVRTSAPLPALRTENARP